VSGAGSNVLRVWDVLGGGRELRALSNHQKTITSLTFDGTRSRFLSGSLDHHVKIYSVADYKVRSRRKRRAAGRRRCRGS